MGKSDREENLPPEDIHCHQLACDIQECIQRNNGMQDKCKDFIKAWEECRDKYRAMNADKEKP